MKNCTTRYSDDLVYARLESRLNIKLDLHLSDVLCCDASEWYQFHTFSMVRFIFVCRDLLWWLRFKVLEENLIVFLHFNRIVLNLFNETVKLAFRLSFIIHWMNQYLLLLIFFFIRVASTKNSISSSYSESESDDSWENIINVCTLRELWLYWFKIFSEAVRTQLTDVNTSHHVRARRDTTRQTNVNPA